MVQMMQRKSIYHLLLKFTLTLKGFSVGFFLLNSLPDKVGNINYFSEASSSDEHIVTGIKPNKMDM